MIIQMPLLPRFTRKVGIKQRRAFSAFVADAVIGYAVRSARAQAGHEGLAGGGVSSACNAAA